MENVCTVLARIIMLKPQVTVTAVSLYTQYNTNSKLKTTSKILVTAAVSCERLRKI